MLSLIKKLVENWNNVLITILITILLLIAVFPLGGGKFLYQTIFISKAKLEVRHLATTLIQSKGIGELFASEFIGEELYSYQEYLQWFQNDIKISSISEEKISANKERILSAFPSFKNKVNFDLGYKNWFTKSDWNEEKMEQEILKNMGSVRMFEVWLNQKNFQSSDSQPTTSAELETEWKDVLNLIKYWEQSTSDKQRKKFMFEEIKSLEPDLLESSTFNHLKNAFKKRKDIRMLQYIRRKKELSNTEKNTITQYVINLNTEIKNLQDSKYHRFNRDLILLGRGTIRAGFNIEDLDSISEDLDENGVMVFRKWEPRLLQASINPWLIPGELKGFEILTSSKSRRLTSEDMTKIKRGCKCKLIQKALDSQLLEIAISSTESILFSMLRPKIQGLSGVRIQNEKNIMELRRNILKQRECLKLLDIKHNN